MSVEISAVNICKICDFSGENFFHRILLVAVKKNFHRTLLVVVKIVFSPLSGEKKQKIIFQRSIVFFHRIHHIERKSYSFIQIHRKSYIFCNF